MSIQNNLPPENADELMRYILERVCALTGNEPSVVKAKSRVWKLMYARYLFFDVATKFHIKPSMAVIFIGRNRTLMYPYQQAVSNLTDVDMQFRSESNKVYESTFDYFCYERT